MRDHLYFVYMVTSRHYGTIYIGVTNDLLRRITEHRNGEVEGFTQRHGVTRLVWFERHGDVNQAILREKRLKRWKRDWKIALIEQENPHWSDLYPTLVERR